MEKLATIISTYTTRVQKLNIHTLGFAYSYWLPLDVLRSGWDRENNMTTTLACTGVTKVPSFHVYDTHIPAVFPL